MYSIYKDNSWSNPREIYDIGTFNDSPNLVAKGNKAYLVWQRANNVLDETNTLEDLYKDMDLYFSEFNGTEFSDPISLADKSNEKFEMGGYLTANENGDFTVLSVENSENNIFDAVGNNSILMKERINGKWNLSEEIFTTNENIECVQATNDKIYFVVSGDENKLYSYDKINKTISLFKTSEDVIIIQSVNDELYYMLDGVLYCLDENDNIVGIMNDCDNDFYVVSNGSQKSILSMKCTKEFQKELFISNYENQAWSEWIPYTNYGSYIRSYSPVMDSNGNVMVALNKVDVDKNFDENIFGESSLIVAKSCQYRDVSISNFICNTDNYSVGDTVELSFDINNYSSNDLSSFSANLYDEHENLIGSYPFNTTVKALDKNEFTIDYTLPEEYRKAQLILKIECGTENDYSNNSSSITLGYTEK